MRRGFCGSGDWLVYLAVFWAFGRGDLMAWLLFRWVGFWKGGGRFETREPGRENALRRERENASCERGRK